MSSGEGVAQVPREPYRGIAPYRYADRHVFFARERQVQALVRAVVINRAMLLYGASGAGKSSLVNAGLLPAAIEAGFAPERIRVQPRVDQELVVERIAVSDDPADGYLPSALLDADGSSSRQVLSAAGLRERIESVQGRDAVPLLLFDQFEELATLFVGYSLLDYNLRLLFKTLRWRVDPARLPAAFSVDLSPDPLIVAIWDEQRRFVKFISQDVWTFVPALYREVLGEDMPP